MAAELGQPLGCIVRLEVNSYVIEYHGLSVYFGGDTAYGPQLFREAQARSPNLHLALLPICPMRRCPRARRIPRRACFPQKPCTKAPGTIVKRLHVAAA
jgi:hypothetical protein